MKKQAYPKRAIAAFVLAILAVLPWIGYILGLVSIILAIDSLSFLRKSKAKGGKVLAIATLVLSTLIMTIKISVFIASFAGNIISTFSELTGLDYEAAMDKCSSQEEDSQTICYVGLVAFHANDTRVTSGETCYQIQGIDARANCFIFVAALTNSTDMCKQIEAEDSSQDGSDMKNYCLAAITNDIVYCGYVKDVALEAKCKSKIFEGEIEKLLNDKLSKIK